ncbi:TonB-dependent receptor domain-containing protein [Owenweeksia hongkongensis]|uniref:TonB-dependent receptor domain-containing protein n=1 Tax=Owenweeksia hongkongensis TaxID=253245 RepID=UPI003A90D548
MPLLQKYTLAATLLIFSVFVLPAQNNISITGTVVDATDGSPIPYATAVAISNSDQKVINGSTTDDDGEFSLNSTSTDISIEISFIGYTKKTIKDFTIRNGSVILGKIQLSQNSESLDEVSVTAEKSSMEFKLDKRVFNVGQDISSSGMGALDVLNNVPSVNVDIEGAISLRGNTGVQILINGKPSVLADEQSNALGTLTADMIESIEVITNPSAKYEAEGTSGIINIILKKEEKKGFNGSASVNTGVPHNHSVGVSLNQRTENFNFFTQFGAGYRSLPRYSESINRNLVDSTMVESDGVSYRNENFYNITLGADYYINDLNTITLSGNFAYEIETPDGETHFDLYDSIGQLYSSYNRIETTEATNPKYQYDLQYKKQFKNDEDHTLLFSTLGRFFGKDQSSEFINEYSFGPEYTANQQTETDFYQADYTFKLDYTNPITDAITLEVGSQYQINDVGNDYAVYDQVGTAWVLDSNLTNNFEYNQKVLGVYGTGSYEGEKWGVKVGLRVENTDLNTLLTNTNESNTQNYTDFFPTLHTSYKISQRFSLQAGYSRRIFRPRLWDLNPFFNIQNNFNVRTGNPDLLPEYADSYELTGVFIFEKASLTSSVYHLYTTDVVERVSFFDNNVNVTTPVNVGTNNKTGLELTGKYSPLDWLSINGDFNYGFFVRQGEFENQNFDFNGDQWSLKFTTKFKLPAGFDLEISPNYRSRYKTVQGEVSGFAFADAGIRKKLWKGKAVINLAVRDIFASRIRESIVDQPTYYVYDFGKRGRFVTLGFSYSFGKGEAMSYSGGRRR